MIIATVKLHYSLTYKPKILKIRLLHNQNYRLSLCMKIINSTILSSSYFYKNNYISKDEDSDFGNLVSISFNEDINDVFLYYRISGLLVELCRAF